MNDITFSGGRILIGDAETRLREIPDGSVHSCAYHAATGRPPRRRPDLFTVLVAVGFLVGLVALAWSMWS